MSHILPAMFRRHRQKVTAAPAGQLPGRARIRRMGLRRALAMLETGERINDELYRWTTTAPRRLTAGPRLATG